MLEDIGEIVRNLIDQELYFQADNPGKFNKDRIMMIHNLAGFELPKQATTSAMPGVSDDDEITIEYISDAGNPLI